MGRRGFLLWTLPQKQRSSLVLLGPFSSFSSPGALSSSLFSPGFKAPLVLEFEFQSTKVPSFPRAADNFTLKLLMSVQEQKSVLLASLKRAVVALFHLYFPRTWEKNERCHPSSLLGCIGKSADDESAFE